MIVRDLLKSKGNAIVSISPSSTLYDAVKLLTERRVSSLLVLGEDSALIGIISERDILRTAYNVREKLFEMQVRHVMTPREKMILGSEDNTIQDVMEIMTNNRIRHLPIMESGKLLGIISIGDVVKGQLDEAVSENRQMQNYILGHYA
ncbi:MAG TPA: CBS domain-containing protein [Oligoflexia bacterium]|nr:CBS domain-containing protein [Oligoflexia bacterium]